MKTANTPSEAIQLFAERMNAGDLEGVLALYEPDATFAPEPGVVVQGTAAIRTALEGLLAISPKLDGRIAKVLSAGDVALVANRWQMAGRTPAGEEVAMGGVSADVVRRQPDGRWLVAVDDPWGTAA
jgi:uncharacterized protein (TIGR02246 family)